jgi:hypothetical protein
MTIYETDTDLYLSYSGSAWLVLSAPGSFRSYTPTFTNMTLGNGTITAVWTRVGAHVTVHLRLVWGSTTSITGSPPGWSGPVDPLDTPTPLIRQEGLCVFYDTSTTNTYTGTIGHGAVNVFYPFALNVTDGLSYLRAENITSSLPMTWATGDIILATWSYEATTP